MNRRFAYIDCFRGLAALWVLVYHGWLTFFPALTSQNNFTVLPEDSTVALRMGYGVLGYGYLGVQLFFVISGFCIHLPQARSAGSGQAFDVSTFLTRRFWRLYPTYLASIVVASILVGFPGFLSEMLGWSQRSDWIVMFRAREAAVSSVFLQHFWPQALQLNSVYWTLILEVQFYLLYPALLSVMRRVGPLSVLGFLLLAEVLFSFVAPPFGLGVFEHFFEWFLGVYAAHLLFTQKIQPRTSLCWTGTLVFAALFAAATLDPYFWHLRYVLAGTSAFCLLCAMASYAGTTFQSSVGFVGNAQAVLVSCLVWLGMISYSLYLVHVRFLVFARYCLDSLVRKGILSAVASHWALIACVPLAIGVAYLFFLLFERPFLSGRVQSKELRAAA